MNLYGCEFEDNVFIGPFVEIQNDVKIGSNTRIQSHSFICANVTVGQNCFIGHGVMFTNDLFDSDNIENEEVSISSIPTDYLPWIMKYDISEVTFDQLNSIQNVSSIDAEAVIKQRELGPIKGTFQLKNSPGISYYGYKNILSNVAFNKNPNQIYFNFESIINSLPSRINDDEDEEPNYSSTKETHRANHVTKNRISTADPRSRYGRPPRSGPSSNAGREGRGPGLRFRLDRRFSARPTPP